MNDLNYTINFEKLANFVRDSKFVARKRNEKSEYKDFDTKIRNMKSKRDAVRYCSSFHNPLDSSQKAIPLYVLLDSIIPDKGMNENQVARILQSVSKTYKQYVYSYITE